MATIIRMPEVLANTTEAVIAEWQVTEGTEVSVGDVLAEIETEKALVEYAAEEAGVIGTLLAKTGETITVGTPIAVLLSEAGEEVDLAALLGPDAGAGSGVGSTGGDDDGVDVGTAAEDAGVPSEQPRIVPAAATEPEVGDDASDGREAAPPSDTGSLARGGAATPTTPTSAPDAVDGAPKGAASGRIFISPLARKLAKERGVDVAQIRGSGPGGRIVRRDIEAFEARSTEQAVPGATAATAAPTAGDAAATTATGVAPAPHAALDAAATGPDGFEEIPHTGMRRAIARRLTESKSTVPHFYLTADCRVDELLQLRRQVNESGSVKISVNDFVLKAVAAAFREVPDANVVWTDTALRRYRSVDVAVAVATEKGLVTPVVRGIESASLSGVSRQVAGLVERARAGRLRQEELEGGTFTVSNLGMYGTREFSAILNPPQSGILAVGAALEQPVVVDGELAVAKVMRCTLSADHRAVDGALAAEWLRAFQHAIEHPLLMLV